MHEQSLYEPPRAVPDINECYFYHTMHIPGFGLVEGEWDLREGVGDYLGRVDFKGKRVLELGPASGFLTFWMEQQGAKVVAFDLSEKQSWDLVPFSRLDLQGLDLDRRKHIRRLNNGFWFNHRAFNSTAQVVYGSVYEIPERIGPVDITTFGSILLHLRDPFLAMQKALALTRETVIVTDVVRDLVRPEKAWLHFLPDFHTNAPADTWWTVTPEVILQFMGILGFEEAQITFHEQRHLGRQIPLYTIVGKRTVERTSASGRRMESSTELTASERDSNRHLEGL